MTSQLSALSEILSSGIATIQGAYAKQGVEFPSLDDAHKPGTFKDEELMRTTNHVIAAATQLIAMVRTPHFTILEGGFAYMFSQSLDAVTNANIPEILREAGPQGLHIHEIGEKCGADPEKIGRILRYLATNYIFREVSIDVFANNRISLFLDTGKSVATIKANPIAKYNNTLSLGSLVSIDESFKAAAYFTDNLLDPTTAKSQDPLDSPFSRAHGRIPVFEFLEKPENEFRMRRFQAGMYVHATSLAQRSSIIVTGFDWGALRKDGVVVDVGGGKGTATLMLARAFPDLQFIIQDRSTVIPLGTELWRGEYPEALTSGRVKFAAHDFFTPQPIQNASVFFLRAILHDWPDAHAKKILAHLRGAASRGTKLIVIEQIIQYAAPSRGAFAGVKGADVPEVPFPLLPNLGPVSNLAVGTDLLMMTGFNAQERTVGQFIRMADGTGWEIESISRGADGVISLLVFGAVDLPSSV